MSTKIEIKFDRARQILKEGDVLLFSGTGWISKLIQRAGEGKYSHAGVASSVGSNGDKIWECVEFREWKGGRSVNLSQYIKQSKKIDVYRPVSSRNVIKIIGGKITEFSISFNGKMVTNTMRRMTGLPYGWKRIAWIARHKLPFLRMFYNVDTLVDDNTDTLIYPVCSTAIAYSFSSANYDLIHHRSDNAMEPSDIARSPLLFYLFTIVP